jgi:predicted alpha-1,6-mannanase (GH76 family)
MKFCFPRLVILLLIAAKTTFTFGQTSPINSGGLYILKSIANNKVLEVSNSSLNNGAAIDCWTSTNSDAQRWIVTQVVKNVYTLTNAASGKLLHLSSTMPDSVKIDQQDNTNSDDAKWMISKAVRGTFSLKCVSKPGFSLSFNEGIITNGTQPLLKPSAAEPKQQWILEKVQLQEAAPTATIAGKVFDAWYNEYKVESGKGFWDRAEMMEILLDASEVTKDTKYIDKFNRMYDSFIENNKADWMYNKYNDDITWAVLFSVRGYLLTGNKAYLDKGKDQFDKMYARAFTNKYGGGLTWYETKTSKNACINGPAMVACCYLAQATGDKSYYDKAIALYTWSKLYLFNPSTGKVNDNVDIDKLGQIKISTWSSTYNQGTYLGAAVMLYNYTKEASYLAEAEKIASYTRNVMFNSGVINTEDGGNDLPGFKGIFARYARMYAMCNKNGDFVEWMRLNAKVAYNNRNSADLIQTKWATRTSEGKPRSEFGSSSAVSLLFNSLFIKD